MRSLAKYICCCLLLTLMLSSIAWSARVTGKVTEVKGRTVTAVFPTGIEPNAMMIVLAGEGESVAGTAVVQTCSGTGPYEITGRLLFVSDAENLVAGRDCYVNSLEAVPPTTRIEIPLPAPPCPVRASEALGYPPTHDLKLYYYAAGQNVGYGTIGLGYERTLRVNRGLALEVDGGITALGSVNGDDPKVVDTTQLIMNANARARFDFSDFFGFYTSYRWTQARGDDEHWSDALGALSGRPMSGYSEFDSHTVMSQGLEYGLTVRPFNKFALSAGYIPSYRSDFGTIGVCCAPAYTGELRLGTKVGALRVRGIKSEDLWQADLGITIR